MQDTERTENSTGVIAPRENAEEKQSPQLEDLAELGGHH